MVLPGFAVLSLAQVVPQYRGKKENLPRVVAPQPIPFSHKLHSRLGLTCGGCHSRSDPKGPEPGFPAPAVCLTCHNTVRKNDPGNPGTKGPASARERSPSGSGSTSFPTSSSSVTPTT